jgi:ATP-dependent Clp protease adaptor protein ClpS
MMDISAAETVVEPDTAEPNQQTEQEARERTKPKGQPPYVVILHNDHLNTSDHVIGVLRKVFNYSRVKAMWLTAQAHRSGRSAVWSGSLEVAELKADQIRACGPDPEMKTRGALALRVSIEPLPQ